jgi:hypothetical protein
MKVRCLVAAVLAGLVLFAVPGVARASLSIDPMSAGFPETTVGTVSAPIEFTVKSDCYIIPSSGPCLAGDPATIQPGIFTTFGPDAFTQTNDCPPTMPGDSMVGTTCTVSVRFTPTTVAETQATLVVGYSTLPYPSGMPYASLYGRGVAAPVVLPQPTPPKPKWGCKKKKRPAAVKKCLKKKRRHSA